MRAYLSIDLDYWCDGFKPWQVRRFFQRVYRLGLPVTVALHHHHLIEDINKRKLDTVINVDYHSDLIDVTDPHKVPLEEGTWANFVAFRGQGTFIWRYPVAKCLEHGEGYCHVNWNPFEKTCTDWHCTQKQQGIARLPWKDIGAIGVCVSPSWLFRPWIVADPLERLGLLEWFGRWTALNSTCDGCRAPELRDMKNGAGKYQPRLTFPFCEV